MTDVAVTAPAAAPASTEAAAPAPGPHMDMTGEEAKAWFDAQKTKDSVPRVSREPKEPSGQDIAKEAAVEAKRRLKISDDEEMDEDEVIKIVKNRRQHQQASSKEMNDAKMLRKQNESFINMMKDPDKVWDVLAKLGHDPRPLTERYLAGKLEEELLTPEQKELREKTARLTAYEKKEQAEREEKEQAAHEELKYKYMKQYETEFLEAIEEVDIPKDQESLALMAKKVHLYNSKKIEITPKEAALLVKEDLKRQNLALLKKATPEQLAALLGDDKLNEVRKWDTSRVRDPEKFLKTPSSQPDPSQVKPRNAPNKTMTPREWRDFNRR